VVPESRENDPTRWTIDEGFGIILEVDFPCENADEDSTVKKTRKENILECICQHPTCGMSDFPDRLRSEPISKIPANDEFGELRQIKSVSQRDTEWTLSYTGESSLWHSEILRGTLCNCRSTAQRESSPLSLEIASTS
jgi:hypothetical protein